MRVLVVGSGGREHALCWSLSRSSLVDELLCAPGNAGIAEQAECLEIPAHDVPGLVSLASERAVDLVVVGPEQPLVLGLVDRLEEKGIRAFGPRQAAARLEGSKAFTRAFCERHGIPMAAGRAFHRSEAARAREHVRACTPPIVLKADGLAAGKGVIIVETVEEALEALEAFFQGRFGAAGEIVVVEEFLQGEEASLFALCDGRTVRELGSAQDHKRAFDGDRGPNTGGMGAYSPTPLLDAAMRARAMREIVLPTVRGMAEEGTPFGGILYAGLMLTREGPKLLEFNVRFGDPEAQVVLPRLESDFAELALAASEGSLHRAEIRWRPLHALTVVMAARGYPGAYEKGTEIRGVEELSGDSRVIVFHAGTRRENGRLLAVGGRVLDVTGLGASLAEARQRAYAAVRRIDWPAGYYRGDIGLRALSAARAAGS